VSQRLSEQIVARSWNRQRRLTVVYSQTGVADERGRCEVRALISRKSLFLKACPLASQSEKFSSNFYPQLLRRASMWGCPTRITQSNQGESNATCMGGVGPVMRAEEAGRVRHYRIGTIRCCKNTIRRNLHSIFHSLHSKVTNAVFYLANTGAAFVTSESRSTLASCDSGRVEATLAGKALQIGFGAQSFSALAQPEMTLLVRASYGRTIPHRLWQESAGHQSFPSGMRSTASRRWEGVGAYSRRRG
jgi:hypothetical protein